MKNNNKRVEHLPQRSGSLAFKTQFYCRFPSFLKELDSTIIRNFNSWWIWFFFLIYLKRQLKWPKKLH